MKKIKFRAWDGKDKEMIQVQILMANKTDDGLTFQDQERRLPLMQFTGLLDKQGKEIYEGDILKGDSSYHSWGRAKNKYFYGEVKFEPTIGYYCEFGEITRKDIDKVHVEIVGNIYKNSELLKIKR